MIFRFLRVLALWALLPSTWVCAHDAGLSQAEARLGDALARPFVMEGEIVPLGARVASAVSVRGDTAASLLRRASEALFDGHVPREASAPPPDEKMP